MNLLIVDDEYLVVEEVVTVTDWELLGMVDKLRQFAWNNVCSRRQILDIINMPKTVKQLVCLI